MFQTLFANKNLRQLFFFLLIGGSGAIAYVLLNTFVLDFWALETFKFKEQIISVGCYSVLILPVYMLQRRFSFESGESVKSTLPKYVFTQMLAICLNFIISYIVFKMLSFPHFWGSVVSIFFTSSMSFILLKLWAFKKGNN